MNPINILFQRKQQNILSVYFTAGFPKLDDTAKIILELQKNKVDLIEVGVPFSDPMADGPVIQHSNSVALQNGMNLQLLFNQLESIKEETHIPLILMTYLNPVMQYGFEKFCQDCVLSGVSGIIIPDLPFNDYMKNYKSITEKFGLKVIMLITPATSEERIRLIDENTDGFIYMVSSSATTGTQDKFNDNNQQYFQRINQLKLKNPRLIGFGISNKETISVAFENASGAIIGSKFIRLLEEEKTPKSAVEKLMEIVG
jgi:tryptophan synthase alpha chain